MPFRHAAAFPLGIPRKSGPKHTHCVANRMAGCQLETTQTDGGLCEIPSTACRCKYMSCLHETIQCVSPLGVRGFVGSSMVRPPAQVGYSWVVSCARTRGTCVPQWTRLPPKHSATCINTGQELPCWMDAVTESLHERPTHG